ncbi:MAG: hypothetical protein JXA73_04575 [Acidobacteria bacterium]|nr:hypothetical protein [Acidobacteriota bacterium]
MQKEDQKPVRVDRRDFIRATTLAGMAGTLSGTSLLAQNAPISSKPGNAGKTRKVLFVSDSLSSYEKLIDSIKAIREYEFQVIPIEASLQRKPQDVTRSVRELRPDILLIRPTVRTAVGNIGNIAISMADLDIPIILLPVNLDLIMMDSDMVAAMRTRGANAFLANSEAHAVELLKIFAVPRILDGKQALIFGRPFDSTSVPMGNLNEDSVYKKTGLRIRYRPVDDLMPLLEKVDEAGAMKEMERWKREAARVLEPSDKTILDAARLYILLRSLVEKEGLAAISIDCLSFSFSGKPPIPLPCLAFTRLRDEGITAPCEADVCALLTSMVLQQISGKPAYQCNVSEVDLQKSIAILRHCVAPLQLMGRNAPPLTYNLRDYHGLGKGATAEVEFPSGIDVTLGLLSKDLKSFVLWPGRTQSRAKDADRLPPGNAPSAKSNVRKYCSNQLTVKFKDINQLHQNLAGCHHVMIAGAYEKALREEMIRMGVNIIGPSDMSSPA